MNKIPKALLVIDAQKYFSKSKKTKQIVKRISAYLEFNINSYKVVYFTIFRNDENSPLWNISDWHDCATTSDADLFDELKEFANKDNIFYKNILSAVKIPQIKDSLERKQIKEVDICGFDTDCCVLATAYDLFDLGIKPVILKNLTWSTSKEKLHNPALKMIERNIGFIKNA